MRLTRLFILLILPRIVQAAPGDSPCTAVEFSTCTSIGSLGYSLSSVSNWYAPSAGVVNPTGTCAGTANMDANYWLKYTATSDDHSIIFNFLKPGGGGSISDCAIQVYSASNCSSTFTPVVCHNNSSDGHAITSSILVTAGTTYYVRLFDASGNGAGNSFQASLNVTKQSGIGQSACNARSISTLPYTFSGNTLCNGNTIAGDCAGKTAGVSGTGEDYYFSYASSGNEYLRISFTGLNSGIAQSLTISAPVSNCSDAKSCYSDLTANGTFPGSLVGISGLDSSYSRLIYLDTAGTYYLVADASGSRGGKFTLSVNTFLPDSSSDICQFPQAVTTIPATYNMANYNFSSDHSPVEPSHPLTAAGYSMENTRWFTFVADTPAPADITVSLNNLSCSTADFGYTSGLEVGIFTGSCGGTWTAVQTFSNITATNSNFTILAPLPGTQYYLIADGHGGAHCTFELSATNVVALPVSLSSFTGNYENGRVLLEWVTQSEANNDYFILERSEDGINFSPFSLVNGAGNSVRPIRYTVDDTNPFVKNYYRLKQVDYDGRMKDLGTVFIKIPTSDHPDFTIYPNPANGRATVRFEDKTTGLLMITDLSGKRIFEREIKQQMLSELDLSTFSTGVYLLHLNTHKGTVTQKLVCN